MPATIFLVDWLVCGGDHVTSPYPVAKAVWWQQKWRAWLFQGLCSLGAKNTDISTQKHKEINNHLSFARIQHRMQGFPTAIWHEGWSCVSYFKSEAKQKLMGWQYLTYPRKKTFKCVLLTWKIRATLANEKAFMQIKHTALPRSGIRHAPDQPTRQNCFKQFW